MYDHLVSACGSSGHLVRVPGDAVCRGGCDRVVCEGDVELSTGQLSARRTLQS